MSKNIATNVKNSDTLLVKNASITVHLMTYHHSKILSLLEVFI